MARRNSALLAIGAELVTMGKTGDREIAGAAKRSGDDADGLWRVVRELEPLVRDPDARADARELLQTAEWLARGSK